MLVLGNQLHLDASTFEGFDPSADAVWMAEVAAESTHVWSSNPRKRHGVPMQGNEPVGAPGTMSAALDRMRGGADVVCAG